MLMNNRAPRGGADRKKIRLSRPMASLRLSAVFFFVVGLMVCAVLADTPLPSPPTRYFTDSAGIISSGAATALNQKLAEFERETSNQLLVVIYPKYTAETSLEDFTQQVYRAWKVGQAGRDNGAILFVFAQDRKMRIQTGRGLEGALPDAICKRIIEDEIAPHFQKKDFDGGLTAGVNAMIAATRGEYKGTGLTVNQRKVHRADSGPGLFPLIFFLIVIFFIIIPAIRRRRGTVYSNTGRSGTPFIWMDGGGGGGFFGGGGGGSSGGDSGGFSGGGGDSGGGGASGGW
jgi:uncharacterized protein